MKFIAVIEHPIEIPINDVIMGVMYHCLGGLIGFNSQENKYYFQPLGLPDQEMPQPVLMTEDDPRMELLESLKVVRKFYEKLTDPETKTKKKEKIPLDNVVKVDFSKGKTS